jgi:hypothetical protein
MVGYFFMCDLLGFKQIIRNSDDLQRTQRIGRWVSLVSDSARATGVEIQLVSDTVFARAEDSAQGLRRLIAFAQRLLNEGVPRSLLIRGAIVRGEYDWGALIYGPAVVDAYELEAAQNWVGVTCHVNVVHADELTAFGSLIRYNPPFKTQTAATHSVIDWSIPSPQQLLPMMGGEGLLKAGDFFTWELLNKLNNTALFSMYKARVRALGGEAGNFYGITGIELAWGVCHGLPVTLDVPKRPASE